MFLICRPCYHGHVYCSKECRERGYKKNHAKAQKKYRQSEKGKEYRKEAAKKYRYQKWLNRNESVKTNKLISNIAPILSKAPFQVAKCKTRCHFCGREGIVVKEFSPRWYKRHPIFYDGSI